MTKQSYTIRAQTAPLERVDDAMLEALAEALTADKQLAGPIAGSNSLARTLGVRTSIDATSPEHALATAIMRIRLALRRAGAGSDVELVDVALMADLEDDEFASARDDVVGTPEVAARLGISRQRVAQLVEQQGRFPTPIAAVRGTHVWRWGDIADWIAAGARDMRRRAPDNTVDVMDALKRSVAREKKPQAAAAKSARLKAS